MGRTTPAPPTRFHSTSRRTRGKLLVYLGAGSVVNTEQRIGSALWSLGGIGREGGRVSLPHPPSPKGAAGGGGGGGDVER